MDQIVKDLMSALRRLLVYLPPDKADYADSIQSRIEAAAAAGDDMSLSAIGVELDARSSEYKVELLDALKSILDSIIKVGLAKLGVGK